MLVEYHRRLPHIHPDDAWIFLTWRLSGTLLARANQRYSTPGHAFLALDSALHQAPGPRWLNDPRVAQLVADAILEGEASKQWYELDAWVVMPNHVHILILPKVPVPQIMRWLKGCTAREANRLLGRAGEAFWLDESYDHFARTTEIRDRIARYIENNPVAARLTESPDQWKWSSAAGQANACPTTALPRNTP